MYLLERHKIEEICTERTRVSEVTFKPPSMLSGWLEHPRTDTLIIEKTVEYVYLLCLRVPEPPVSSAHITFVTLSTTGTQNWAEDNINSMGFEISWHHVDKGNIQFERGTRWGIWRPNGLVSWEPEVRRALSQAGILLTQVEKLQDATSLDGLACIWGTASDTDVPGHALSLTSEALTQLQAAAESSFAQPIGGSRAKQ